jgi:hypothetical protein
VKTELNNRWQTRRISSKAEPRKVMSLTKEQYYAIEAVSRASSVLSLTGSFFVVGTFLFSNHFRSAINRLFFYASWGNILTNVGSLMSRAPIEDGVNRPFCQFQAFILEWYSYLFTCSSIYVATYHG